MKTHTLKTWPEYFEAVADGRKTFEIRKNDRDFSVGDRLILQEWIPPAILDGRSDGKHTGRTVTKEITYIMDQNPFVDLVNPLSLQRFVVLGLRDDDR